MDKVRLLDRHSPRPPALQPLHHHHLPLRSLLQDMELHLPLPHRLLPRLQLVTGRYVFTCHPSDAC